MRSERWIYVFAALLVVFALGFYVGRLPQGQDSDPLTRCYAAMNQADLAVELCAPLEERP